MAHIAATIGGAAALYGGSAVATALGFTQAGIAAGSTAATMMGVLGAQAGGVVATAQAIGATATVFVSAPAVITVAGVGAVGGYAAYEVIRLFS